MSPPREANELILSGAIQILFSSIVGAIMLIPMQPWGKSLMARIPKWPDLVRAHVDWLVLSLMQFCGAFMISSHSGLPNAWLVSRLLIFGGWSNPVTYLVKLIL
jgi:hypothetical protein